MKKRYLIREHVDGSVAPSYNPRTIAVRDHDREDHEEQREQRVGQHVWWPTVRFEISVAKVQRGADKPDRFDICIKARLVAPSRPIPRVTREQRTEITGLPVAIGRRGSRSSPTFAIHPGFPLSSTDA